jgi:hypothetical protein
MRICIPQILGHRGAGLGNELFPWAKAFLAGQVLGARVMHPAWGLNKREYYRDFGTSRLDWLQQCAIKSALPVVHFDEAAYRATGKAAYGEAVAQFAANEELDLRGRFVFLASGMWGGFHAIQQARVFVLAELLKARQALANLHATLARVRPGRALVAVHIRRGDFLKADAVEDYRGRFNVALPLAWYLATCSALKRDCGNCIEFLLITDAAPGDVQEFIDAFHPLTTFHLRQTACSDLLAMAFADALVCSVSSYSMWGAFLSRAPYIWCAANLQDHEGYGSLWGDEAGQQAPAGPTAINLWRGRIRARQGHAPASGRGTPVDWSGEVPAAFSDCLLARLDERAEERDLILYGVVPLEEAEAPAASAVPLRCQRP